MYALPYLLLVRIQRLALDARRRDRTWRYYAYTAAAGVLAAFLISVIATVALVLLASGWWWLAILLVVLFAVPVLEPVLARHVFVPLGWVKPAYWIAHFSTAGDSDAHGLAMAAWAHAHRPTPEHEAWITARRDRRIPLGDAEIVVTGLLAAARGDADGARLLLRSTEHMVENHPRTRELAGEWLAVDAVERGAWAELADDGHAARWPASALTFLLEGVAARRIGAAPAPGPMALWARWLIAPYRGATRALIADVVSGSESESDPVSVSVSVSGSDSGSDSGSGSDSDAVSGSDSVSVSGSDSVSVSLGRAIDALLRVEQAASAARLADAVTSWDTALGDGATISWLTRRAVELDAPIGSVDRALREVAAAVTDALARCADAASLGAPGAHGPVGGALARRLRHGRLDALEAGFTRWEERRRDGAVRAPIDEWREWIALRAAYDAAVASGGLELRRLAFPHVYSKGTSMAVWLWNARDEYAISHAISRWLLAEALAVGDTEAIELCTRNTRLAVPTRTGHVTP
jgi:hypothetical protein